MNPLWAQGIAECDTVEKFNQLAVSTARDQRKTNPEFARLVVAEAKKRRYTWMGERESGWYIEVTPEEITSIMARLDYKDRKDQRDKMRKMLRKTKVEMVSASWDFWEYGQGVDLGAMLITDFRKRKNNLVIYEYDRVPKDLYFQLFTKDAKMTLTNIYRMFSDQIGPVEIRNWKEAI